MSSASASRPAEPGQADTGLSGAGRWLRRLGRAFWPEGLFGRLLVAVLAGVLAAQTLSVVLVSREREREYIQSSVREWTRRIADRTLTLEALPADQRLELRGPYRERFGGWPPFARLPFGRQGPGADPGPDPGAGAGAGPGFGFNPGPGPGGPRSPFYIASPVQLPDFRQSLERQLASELGGGYTVRVQPTTASGSAAAALPLMRRRPEAFERGGRSWDVAIGLPSGEQLLFRIEQGDVAAPLPRALIMNLLLLVLVTAIVLYLVTRTVTQPLSRLARAAEAMGRDLSQPPLPERGVVELREAAHAFNTMQERLHRYVGSRTSVLAAMSHDLKTPLTRLRLRCANLEDQGLAARIEVDLDEMESMVKGTLAMLRGLNDQEPEADVDVDALLATLQGEFADMGVPFPVQGRAQGRYRGRPQALKRCLTNLLSNAVKFGAGVRVVVEDGAQLVIRVLDDGPGIPPTQLQKVFEPFYRLESSRNRDTGGTGLGLGIARDIAQSHGGQLTLANRQPHGLAAVLVLPRSR